MNYAGYGMPSKKQSQQMKYHYIHSVAGISSKRPGTIKLSVLTLIKQLLETVLGNSFCGCGLT